MIWVGCKWDEQCLHQEDFFFSQFVPSCHFDEFLSLPHSSAIGILGQQKKPPRKLRGIGQQALRPFCRAPVLWSRPVAVSTEFLQSNNHRLYQDPPHPLSTSSGRLLIFYHWLEGWGGLSPTLSGRPSPTTWLASTDKNYNLLGFLLSKHSSPQPVFLPSGWRELPTSRWWQAAGLEKLSLVYTASCLLL